MLSLERIPDQVGHLVLTEDGAVLTVMSLFTAQTKLKILLYNSDYFI